jgi:ubiquinone biosynthesis protein UbiJ
MSTEMEAFRRDICEQFVVFQQLVAERTVEILAAIARHHEVRDRVEQQLEELELSVSRLEQRTGKLENPSQS